MFTGLENVHISLSLRYTLQYVQCMPQSNEQMYTSVLLLRETNSFILKSHAFSHISKFRTQ
jgi:hypothetical protein